MTQQPPQSRVSLVLLKPVRIKENERDVRKLYQIENISDAIFLNRQMLMVIASTSEVAAIRKCAVSENVTLDIRRKQGGKR